MKRKRKKKFYDFKSVENHGIVITVIDRDKNWGGYLENFPPKIVRVLFVYNY